MKRKLCFCLLIAISFSVFSYAQKQEKVQKWSVIPKAGVIASTINAEHVDPRVGALLGFETEYQASKVVSLSTGLMFSSQGFLPEDRKVADRTVVRDYFNIPLLVKVYALKGLAINVGLQIGLLLEARENIGFKA